MNTLSPAEQAAAIFEPAKLVDELGLVKAEIAALELREKALKEALIAAGQDTYAGTFYDVTVTHSERSNWDMPRLKADLGDMMDAYAKPATQIITVKVVAKK